jgi:hypothetical protein
MTALWQLEINLSASGASRSARIFVMILAIVCMRLIGRKSLILSDPSFFGSSMMLALFSRFRCWQHKSYNELTA